MTQLQIVRSLHRMNCTCNTCRAPGHIESSCGHEGGYTTEEDRARRERKRQNQIAHREREKSNENNERVTGDAPVENIGEFAAAERAETRCAADWRRFTAEESRNAVTGILEAIAALSDEQRDSLFETLKDSYQWKT